MIDYIEILNLPVTVDMLLSNPWLEFSHSDIAVQTGEELDRKQHAIYNTLVFTVRKRNEVKKLKGSLHHYHNKRKVNFNDLTPIDIARVVIDLSEKFQIDPFRTVLNNVEFGVNLITDQIPKTILQDIIRHNGAPFRYIDKGLGKDCKHNQYRIKIYDKGLHNERPENILRIEIHVDVMEYLQSKKIPLKTLGDLFNPELYPILGQNLIDRVSEILFYDSTIDTGNLSENEQIILSNGRNPDFWDTCRDKSANDTYLRRYKRTLDKHLIVNWKEILLVLIREKVSSLLTLEKSQRDVLTQIYQTKNFNLDINRLTPCDTIVNISYGVKNEISGQRVCLSCGQDISHQNTRSKFCSAKYVGERVAHRCRNKNSNPINYLRRRLRIEQSELTLFDTRPYFINLEPI